MRPLGVAVLAALVVALGSGRALAATGGPDALGITWADAADGCSTDTPVLTGAATRWLAPTGVLGPVNLGFAMPFAGRVVTQAWISPTGFVAFSDQGAAGASDVTQALPDATPPNDLVAPLWKPSLAEEVDAESFGDRFVIAWLRDESAPRLTPCWLTLHRDGRMTVTYNSDRFVAFDATVAYENADGSEGTTFWRDGSPVEPGFLQPMNGRSLCLQPPTLLDCGSPLVVSCGDDAPLVLPAAVPEQAEVYSCATGTYPGNERVARLDVTTPQHVTVSIDSPVADVFEVSTPPECSEAHCIGFADQALDLPVAFAGSHWFVVDEPRPGGDSLRLRVACAALPDVGCGASHAGTTLGMANTVSSYGCASAVLDGPEAHVLVTTATAGHLALTLPGSTPGSWLVVRDTAGRCLGAGPGGTTLFAAPAATYVVTIDGERGAAGPFTLQVDCGTRLACTSLPAAPCNGSVVGDTSRGVNDRVAMFACGAALMDGPEDAYLLETPRDEVVALRFTSRQPGQEAFLLSSCDEGSCVFGPDQGSCAFLTAGPHVLVIDGPAGSEGPYELAIECLRDAVPGVDVRAVDLDASALVTDCRERDVAGTVRVALTNDGSKPAPPPFDVVVFSDVNGSGDFEPGTDTMLGTATVTSPVAAGAVLDVDVSAAGALPFREAVVHAKVDPSAALPDVDRGNQVVNTGAHCTAASPPPLPLDARVEWAWTGSAVAPTFIEVESVPLVGDLDGDGLPEVLFTTQETATGAGTGSMLRAVSGRDGSETWTADAPALRLRVGTAQALGDLDGDGSPEIVGQSHADTSRLLCLDANGALRWTSGPLSIQGPFDWYYGAPVLADIDGDGRAEVAWGPNVLDADGQPFWTPEPGGTLGSAASGGGPIAVVADLDADGVQEVIAGPTAYRLDAAARAGRIFWTNAAVPDGFAAIANLDDDAAPEVVVTSPYRLDVLDGLTGAIQWSMPLPVGGGGSCGGFAGTAGGPPTIADVDGDGEPEILVVVADWLSCWNRGGTLKWKGAIAECSSGTTSATVFDLDGDGRQEVVLKDEVAIRFLRGEDGKEILAIPGTSGTAREMPVVADVDADGQAEVVVVENRLLGGSGVGLAGIRVLGSASSPWMPARAAWNQHAYHVTNINADLSVPRPSGVACRPPSPLAEGTFRVQRGAPREAPLAPNVTLTLLSASRVGVVGCRQDVRVDVRVGNGGGASTGDVVSVAFYDGDPASGGRFIASQLLSPLVSGAFADAGGTFSLTSFPTKLVIVADDDGTGRGAVTECREDDNACVVTDADLGGPVRVPPVDVGPALRVRSHGDPNAADVTAVLDWTLDAGAPRPPNQHHHLLRGVVGQGRPTFSLIPGTEPFTMTTYAESTPRTPDTNLPHVWCYVLRAADACELESAD